MRLTCLNTTNVLLPPTILRFRNCTMPVSNLQMLEMIARAPHDHCGLRETSISVDYSSTQRTKITPYLVLHYHIKTPRCGIYIGDYSSPVKYAQNVHIIVSNSNGYECQYLRSWILLYLYQGFTGRGWLKYYRVLINTTLMIFRQKSK